ncbi:MAG: hypothetical protein JWM12_3235 [Ilumatobacteraceae bacterium]|jgi:drug/metabolite transporter (DMT)-like permease|nr:hypothetical protein [Ilumatobacteraceae bacterium]
MLNNLHWYVAVGVIVGGLVSVLQGSVLLGDVLIVVACVVWPVGYTLQTRRTQLAAAPPSSAPN